MQTRRFVLIYVSFFFPFFIRYLTHLHFQCYTKSPPYPPTPTALPTHSPFLALVFPCTGAYDQDSFLVAFTVSGVDILICVQCDCMYN